MSRQKRNAYYTPPSLLGCVGIIVATILMTGFVYLMDSGTISLVRLTRPCEDGRQVSIRVPDSREEANIEFEKQGCYLVKGVSK